MQPLSPNGRRVKKQYANTADPILLHRYAQLNAVIRSGPDSGLHERDFWRSCREYADIEGEILRRMFDGAPDPYAHSPAVCVLPETHPAASPFRGEHVPL